MESFRDASARVLGSETEVLVVIRCMRHCYQCPECTASLSIVSLEAIDPNMSPAEMVKATPGPWALMCPHCAWTTKEIGLELERPNAIPEQLARLKREDAPFGPRPSSQRRPSKDEDADNDEDGPDHKQPAEQGLDKDTQFSNLKAFYISQLSKSTNAAAAGDGGNTYRYGSPGSLARLVNIYTGVGPFPNRTSKPRKEGAREACGVEEGLKVVVDDEDEHAISKMREVGWEGSR